MRPAQNDWVRGDPVLRRAIPILAWSGLAGSALALVGIFYNDFFPLHSFALALPLTPGIVGVAFDGLAVYLPRHRPGCYDIRVSSVGFTVRYPVRIQTYGWSELSLYDDRRQVEVQQGRRSSILALTPTQYETVRRAYRPPGRPPSIIRRV